MTFAIDSADHRVMMSSTKGSFSVHEVDKQGCCELYVMFLSNVFSGLTESTAVVFLIYDYLNVPDSKCKSCSRPGSNLPQL